MVHLGWVLPYFLPMLTLNSDEIIKKGIWSTHNGLFLALLLPLSFLSHNAPLSLFLKISLSYSCTHSILSLTNRSSFSLMISLSPLLPLAL